MKMLDKLNAMRNHGGAIQTQGLDDETILRFAQQDERLGTAVDTAYTDFLTLLEEEPGLMALPEAEQVKPGRKIKYLLRCPVKSSSFRSLWGMKSISNSRWLLLKR